MRTKTYVGKHTKQLQERLFTLGFQWLSRTVEIIESATFLYIRWDTKMISYDNTLEWFLIHDYTEMSIGQLHRILEKLEVEYEMEKKAVQFKNFGKRFYKGPMATCFLW